MERLAQNVRSWRRGGEVARCGLWAVGKLGGNAGHGEGAGRERVVQALNDR